MKSLLITFVCAYVLLCIVLFFFQRKLLYYPNPEVNLANEKEISFDHDGVKLHGWVINEGEQRALLYYGGNAEALEMNISFFKAVASNYSIYLINYRGYGKSEGKPFEKALLSDALFVYDEIASSHKSIAVMGRSLGSGIATYVAANRSVEKLILVSPYDSIQSVAQSFYRLFPVSILLQDKYESMKNIESIDAKTLILYATHDEVINPKHTQNLITYFKDQSLSVVSIEKAKHNDISMYKKYAQTIRDFLD